MYCSIIVKGHLDQRWSERFDGLTITNLANGTTVLAGPLPDQAAVHGMLLKVRDLSLTLVSVRCEDAACARRRLGWRRGRSRATGRKDASWQQSRIEKVRTPEK